VDHSAPTTITLEFAPAPSTSTARSKSAPLLEAHLGAVVGAVAGVIEEGVAECQDGGLTSKTKSQSAKFLCELLFLRQYMLDVGFSDFDRLAKERGVEVLVACDTPAETVNFLVGETMKLLEKLVRQQAN